MIKNFLQKHRAILITVVITSAITTTVASGYFVIKNEKEKANQQVEVLQKSIEELQAKNETNQEASKEAEKDIPVSEITIQQTPATKKSVEVAPIKIEEVEEKLVSCLTYVNTTVKVSESECDLIKQRNEKSKDVDEEYKKCVDALYAGLNNCLQEAQKKSIDAISWCENLWDINNGNKSCLEDRNSQMKKIWK